MFEKSETIYFTLLHDDINEIYDISSYDDMNNIMVTDIEDEEYCFNKDTIFKVQKFVRVEVSNFNELFSLMKSKKIYITVASDNPEALIQNFTEEPIDVVDTLDEIGFDDFMTHFNNYVFAKKIGKEKDMTLEQIISFYE